MPSEPKPGTPLPGPLKDWPLWERKADLDDGREHWTLCDTNGNKRAEVWGGTWHTFDEHGVGGENDDHPSGMPFNARRAAGNAILRYIARSHYPEALAQLAELQKPCVWTWDDEHECWLASCGGTDWDAMTTSERHQWKYCQHCGHKIESHPIQEVTEDE